MLDICGHLQLSSTLPYREQLQPLHGQEVQLQPFSSAGPAFCWSSPHEQALHMQVIDMQNHGKTVCRLESKEQADRDVRVASLVDTLRDLEMNNEAALKHYVERALKQQK